MPHTPPPLQTSSEDIVADPTFQYDQPMLSPRTPQPQIASTPLNLDPPDPPRVRIKRRRPLQASDDIPVEEPTLLSSSQRVPSIELSEPNAPISATLNAPHTQDGFLAPVPTSSARATSPPRTPLMKLQTSFSCSYEDPKTPEPWSPHSALSKGESITRPSSTWSELSDSSASSLSSLDTFVTNGESCTSPDSELNDPFTFPDSKSGLMPSAIPRDLISLGKRVKFQTFNHWSSEMDEHLWLTYMTYLSDPTVTPFKTLPGTAPPLGVCHRVARRAKKHWKRSRTSLSTVTEDQTSTFASLDGTLMQRQSSVPLETSPATLKAHLSPRSFSAGARKNVGKWPYSGGATRKRLRELCKRKPALSPHYQRLMQTRSPSPFETSSSTGQNLSSPKPGSAHSESSFSTRDLNTTLSTSTASTMQPGNPLSQLASSSPKTPQRINPHLKSSSLQSTFALANEQQHQEGLASLRRLASPFQEQPRRNASPLQETAQSAKLSVPQPQQRHLASPLELQHPQPMSASMKRRAQAQLGEELLTDDPELRRSFLEDIFRDPAAASGKRRIRSRGFSLGAVRHAGGASREHPQQFSELFTPPSTEATQQSSSSFQSKAGNTSINPTGAFRLSEISELAPPNKLADGAIRRLGSPFVPTRHVEMSNTFPRNLFPHGLDRMSGLDTQRPEHELEVGQEYEQAKADVEMEDPFIDSFTGTIRRYNRE